MAIDTTSPTWKAVEAWANETLAAKRARLESPHVPENETAALRGSIAFAKALLALGRPAPTETPADHKPAGY